MSRLMLDGSPNPFRNDEYDPFAAVSGSPPAPAGLEDTLTDPAPLQGVLALKATDLAVPPNSTKSFSPSDRKQSVYSLETALRRKSMFAAPDANIPGTVTATATIPINSEGVPSLAKETKVKNSAPPSPAPVTPVTGSVAPMAAAPVPSSATRRASGARRPSGMMFHPGIPSIAKAGSMVQATAGTAVTRQASVVVRDGVIMLQGLAGVQEDAEAPGDLQPSQGGNPIKSLIRRMSRRLSVISGAKEGGGGVGAPLAPSAARRISRPVVGLGLTMEEEESSNDTFHSTSEFPEGYLLGFSECREVLEPIELSVEGHIPSWLSGVFYRCGPGKFEVETELLSPNGENKVVAIDHWFDGFSLLHRFEMRDGRVWYRNRFTSETQESVMKATGALPLSFAQSGDPCKSFFKKFFTISLAVPTEFNVNVAVTPHFPRRDPTAASGWRNVLLAKTDANILQELDPTTLQPKGYTTYTAWNPQLSGIMTSAHEHFDTNTGEYINFLQEPGPVIRTRVFTINPALAAGGEVVCTIVTRLASYMHSFAVTDKYIVLIACPYYWTMGGIPIVFTQQVASALEWHGHLPVSFYVIDRATRRHVATYQGDSFFVFHIINSFDLARGGGGPSTAPPASFSSGATPAAATGGSHNEDDDIVIDLCAYRTPNNIQEMYLDKFRTGTTNFEASHVRRYTLRNVRQVAQDQSSMLAAAGRSWWQTMAGWLWTAPTPAPAPAAAAAAPARHASKLRRKSSRPASAGGPDGSGITNTYPRATYEIRSGLGPEMPVIHPAYARRASYRYAFCVLASSRMPFEALAKVDVVAGTQIEWRSNGCFPSEPVVVPRPGGVDEDDACILSVVLDGAARASFVLVLDARTFTEIGRASFQIGGVVPFGFHGTFTDQLGGSDP